jgi:hypothetical protein
MVAEAKARGLELTGPGGLLKLFTKNVLKTALNEEMTEHLGHDKNRVEAGRESATCVTAPGQRPLCPDCRRGSRECGCAPVHRLDAIERFSTSVDWVLDVMQGEDGLHGRGRAGRAAAQLGQQFPRLEGRDGAFGAGAGVVHGFLPG